MNLPLPPGVKSVPEIDWAHPPGFASWSPHVRALFNAKQIEPLLATMLGGERGAAPAWWALVAQRIVDPIQAERMLAPAAVAQHLPRFFSLRGFAVRLFILPMMRFACSRLRAAFVAEFPDYVSRNRIPTQSARDFN